MRSDHRSALCVLLLSSLVSATAGARTSTELLAAQGILSYGRGQLERACTLLQRAAAGHPVPPGVLHHLGLAQLRLGQRERGRRTLARAARLEPHNARLLLDLGLAYLREGNTAWAVRQLGRARALDLLDGRIRYHLGVALLRQGDGPGALEQLRAARHEPGLDWRAVRLQLGLALYHGGRWSSSRQMLQPLLGFDRFGVAANQILRSSHEAQGTGAAWVDGEVAVGAVVDSNPLYEHESTAPTAVGPSVAASLTLRPYVGRRTLVWGHAAGGRVFYLPTGEETTRHVGDVSRTDVQGTAMVARRFALQQGWLQLTGGYSFGLTLLDGDPPLADVNHIFVEQHAGHLSLLRRGAMSNSATTQLRYSLSREEYADLPRSSWGNQLELEHGRALGTRFRLLCWLSLRHELARSTDYQALIPGAGAGLSFAAPWRLVLGARLGYEHEDHFRSAAGRWGEQRLDHTLDAMVEVGRPLWWGLRLRAVYRRLQNFSTVSNFDYGRQLATFNLSWSSR